MSELIIPEVVEAPNTRDLVSGSEAAVNTNTSTNTVDALYYVTSQLDSCFLRGFVGAQYDILNALPSLFVDTSLQQRIEESITALRQGVFLEPHFVSLAAARMAVQGMLYETLHGELLSLLDRQLPVNIHTIFPQPAQTHPLLDSTRNWLMELAITGFARLEKGMLLSFAPTLTQLQKLPEAIHLSALLTGFLNEMLAALPIKDANEIPLRRWCDLWGTAMINAVALAKVPDVSLVSGTLFPLGVEVRQHSRMASLVVYGVLVSADNQARFVRQTWSSFKVAALRSDEAWLLFPDAQLLLQSLLQSKSLLVNEMPLLPSGDLLWKSDSVKAGKKYNLFNIASQYFAPGLPSLAAPLPLLERHPVQIAEPVVFTNYQVKDATLHLSNGTVLALDTTRRGLPLNSLEQTTFLFGLLHYNAGQWSLQVLTAGNDSGSNTKFEIVGQRGIELLKKPPKSTTLSILKERSSRLLRK